MVYSRVEQTSTSASGRDDGEVDGTAGGDRPLSIAIFSKADRSGGGASLIAELLAELLLNAGHHVDHWVAYHSASPKPFMRAIYGARWRRISRLHWLTGQFGLQELVPWEFRQFKHCLKDYDVAHFHDISSVISPLTVRRVAQVLPTAWTFHDCSPFTGGCLYPMDCQRFHTRCGECPQLGQWPLHGGCHRRLRIRCDFTGYMQDLKRHTARQDLFAPVTPSGWMADEAVKSGMFSQRPRVIPNPVDSSLFRPYRREVLRELLGLPKESFIVLVSASYLGDKRKGAEYAIRALNQCQRKVSAVLIGHPAPELVAQLQVDRICTPGYVSDQRLLSMYYGAADVFMFPTLIDNLPCSILETMACGTPIVGFRTGGVPDMVEHGTTGWLAELGDVDGLVRGLQVAYDQPQIRDEWALAGRRKVEERFTGKLFVDAHLELYEQLLKRRRP